MRAGGREMGSTRPPFADVIHLSEYRDLRSSLKSPTLLYLNREGAWLDSLDPTCALDIEDIRSALGLRHALVTRQADLVLIESDLDWMDPIDAVSELNALGSAPIVLIRRGGADDEQLLKRAFAAGLYDALSAPLCPEELRETLTVLLKMRRCAE